MGTCDFSVYTGKDESVEKDLGPKVVNKLSRPLVGGHYHLSFDNFFSTVKLFDDLLEDGIYSCGTFRRDRVGVPQDMKDTKVDKHTKYSWSGIITSYILMFLYWLCAC